MLMAELAVVSDFFFFDGRRCLLNTCISEVKAERSFDFSIREDRGHPCDESVSGNEVGPESSHYFLEGFVIHFGFSGLD
jgi:hypothetical protein